MTKNKGFTLIEIILAIVVMSIIGTMTVAFINAPAKAYTDLSRRTELTDLADAALRRISRDLQSALPNSVRVTGTCNGTAPCYLELLQTTGGGRYRAAGPGNILDFTQTDSSFEVIGAMPAAAVGSFVAIYNLGIPGADAYNSDNIASISSVGGASLSIAAKQFPFESSSNRFQVVSGPVTYVCDPASGTIKRYWGYAIQPSQPNNATIAPLSGASQAYIATNVSSCQFLYDTNIVSQRNGLVTLRITESKDGETSSIYTSAHVDNVP